MSAVRIGFYRIVAILALSAGLAACATSTTSASRPTPTTTPSPTATPALTLRVSADWSQGLTGWQATPGWTVVNGALESSTADNLAFTIPYQPHVGHFMLEMDVQVVDVPHDGGGYILNMPAGTATAGYQVGVSHLLVPGPRPFGLHPTILAIIVPTEDEQPAPAHLHEADYEPGDGVRTYRIVVDDPLVELYVDDRFWVSASTVDSAPLAAGPLTIQVSGVHLRITRLQLWA